jgi:hypothetical protein
MFCSKVDFLFRGNIINMHDFTISTLIQSTLSGSILYVHVGVRVRLEILQKQDNVGQIKP